MLRNLQLYIYFLQYLFQVNMQVTIIYCNENDKSDKFFMNKDNFSEDNKFFIDFSKSYGNGNFLDDPFGNGNI